MTAFTDLPLPAPIAAALAGRGYETATAVQAAVLDPALAGRDLLVSAQTGSGKTVAFGTLIAEALLAGPPRPRAPKPDRAADGEAAPEGAAEAPPPPPARRPGPPPPRALVVAPTRELAAQVARELEWLFDAARITVGAFTGGTAVVGDLRLLRRGLQVAVGTPGRLVDLHRRGALDLSGVEALVLDEADEMLDLGFKEDLETLLGAAPADRRTLLFSATIPRDVERMARTYMRDPLRVDTRPDGSGRAHADISYVAHLVRPQDRLAAVVNVLLAAGDSKAIVFCRTRDGVGGLQQRLVDHGFRAVAMAGDRAQNERDRALDALREGRARVLVATNVAARGLDLPDVEVVVHADLPENAEALTHRSGRTGRAGRKGTSVVIAERVERRKAERLLSMAGARFAWTAPPTADEVRGAAQDRWVEALLEEAKSAPSATRRGRPVNRGEEGEEGDERDDAGDDAEARADDEDRREADERDRHGIAALADRLGAMLPERVLLSLLLRRELDRLPAGLPLQPVPPERGRRGADGVFEDERRRPAWTRAVLFRVNLGAAAKAEPGWLLPLICRRGGVTRQDVGAIRIGPSSSTFEISAEAAEDFAAAAMRPDPRAPHVRIERMDGPGGGAAPPERPRVGAAGPGGKPARRGPVEARAPRPPRDGAGARPGAALDDGPGRDASGEEPARPARPTKPPRAAARVEPPADEPPAARPPRDAAPPADEPPAARPPRDAAPAAPPADEPPAAPPQRAPIAPAATPPPPASAAPDEPAPAEKAGRRPRAVPEVTTGGPLAGARPRSVSRPAARDAASPRPSRPASEPGPEPSGGFAPPRRRAAPAPGDARRPGMFDDGPRRPGKFGDGPRRPGGFDDGPRAGAARFERGPGASRGPAGSRGPGGPRGGFGGPPRGAGGFGGPRTPGAFGRPRAGEGPGAGPRGGFGPGRGGPGGKPRGPWAPPGGAGGAPRGRAKPKKR